MQRAAIAAVPPPLASLGACRRGLSLCSRPGAMACVSPPVAGKNKTPKSAAGAQTPLISDGYLQARPHRCPSSAGRRRAALSPPVPPPTPHAAHRSRDGGDVLLFQKAALQAAELPSPCPRPCPSPPPPQNTVRRWLLEWGRGKPGSKDPEPIQRQPHCRPKTACLGMATGSPTPSFPGSIVPPGMPFQPCPHFPTPQTRQGLGPPKSNSCSRPTASQLCRSQDHAPCHPAARTCVQCPREVPTMVTPALRGSAPREGTHTLPST